MILNDREQKGVIVIVLMCLVALFMALGSIASDMLARHQCNQLGGAWTGDVCVIQHDTYR